MANGSHAIGDDHLADGVARKERVGGNIAASLQQSHADKACGHVATCMHVGTRTEDIRQMVGGKIVLFARFGFRGNAVARSTDKRNGEVGQSGATLQHGKAHGGHGSGKLHRKKRATVGKGVLAHGGQCRICGRCLQKFFVAVEGKFSDFGQRSGQEHHLKIAIVEGVRLDLCAAGQHQGHQLVGHVGAVGLIGLGTEQRAEMDAARSGGHGGAEGGELLASRQSTCLHVGHGIGNVKSAQIFPA